MSESTRLQRAFVDGFLAGQQHARLPRKFPPVAIAWLKSRTRRKLGLKLRRSHKWQLGVWHTQTVEAPAYTIESLKRRKLS